MKIRSKLFVGFGVVVAIGIFIGAVGFYTNKQLTASSEDMLHLSETRSTVTSILVSHYVWRHGLSETVYAGAEFSDSLDSTTCSLGKWLNSEEVKRITEPDEVALLRRIVEPHNFIHSRAREIISHLDNGEADEAIKIFREEVLPKTQEVITGLEEMNDLYGVFLADKTHETYALGLRFETFIMAVIIIALIAGVILTLIITSNIVKPIIAMKKMFKSLEEGDLIKHSETNRNDELGDLISSFKTETAKIYYDPLTGIYNRRYFDEGLKRVMKALSRSGGVLSMMMIDIDFFKNYNDTYGHSEGDKCLTAVTNILSQCINRADDFLARYGGEEFVIVLPNTGEYGVGVIAGRLLESMRGANIPHKKSDAAPYVTVSIGATSGTVEHAQTGEAYIQRADEAMYQSKQNGRNRYTFEKM